MSVRAIAPARAGRSNENELANERLDDFHRGFIKPSAWPQWLVAIWKASKTIVSGHLCAGLAAFPMAAQPAPKVRERHAWPPEAIAYFEEFYKTDPIPTLENRKRLA